MSTSKLLESLGLDSDDDDEDDDVLEDKHNNEIKGHETKDKDKFVENKADGELNKDKIDENTEKILKNMHTANDGAKEKNAVGELDEQGANKVVGAVSFKDKPAALSVKGVHAIIPDR